jgi:hypothetical protein
MTEGFSAEPTLDGGGGVPLRERIDKALQDSMDRCARCKACDYQVDAVLGVLREVLAEKDAEIARLEAEGTEHRRTIRAISDARRDEPEGTLPDGEYARVEILGHDYHTGWVTERDRAGVRVLVIADWDGRVLAEVPGQSLYRYVPLPTPLKRPDERTALPPAGGSDDYSWSDEPFGEGPF